MKYIALICGIHVSGKNIVKMEVLRKYMETYGFENVITFIQSGNIIFETKNLLDQKFTRWWL